MNKLITNKQVSIVALTPLLDVAGHALVLQPKGTKGDEREITAETAEDEIVKRVEKAGWVRVHPVNAQPTQNTATTPVVLVPGPIPHEPPPLTQPPVFVPGPIPHEPPPLVPPVLTPGPISHEPPPLAHVVSDETPVPVETTPETPLPVSEPPAKGKRQK